MQQKQFFAIVLVVMLMAAFAASGWTAEDMININTASAKELMKLERVGKAYSARIIEFREANGPFETIEDLMKVPGIGKKTFEANKDRMTVE